MKNQEKKNREVGRLVVGTFLALLVLGFAYMSWLGQHQEADAPTPRPVATNGI